MRKSLVATLLLVCCALLSAAQQQPTSRDLFWSNIDLVDVTPNPANPAPPQTPQPVLLTSKGYGKKTQRVPSEKNSSQPLGLRYSLLKVGPNNQLAEVLPETVFHSGDKVKVSVMANRTGYIYIIQQGSSGKWHALFPAKADVPESNRVETGKIYQLPAKSLFQFDQQTGSEHLFILLSRQAVSDIDEVIFTLSLTGVTPVEAKQAPLEAKNKIDDALGQHWKGRDLLEVQDPPQEVNDVSLGENAMYVISQGKGIHSASQVFAELVLDHQ